MSVKALAIKFHGYICECMLWADLTLIAVQYTIVLSSAWNKQYLRTNSHPQESYSSTRQPAFGARSNLLGDCYIQILFKVPILYRLNCIVYKFIILLFACYTLKFYHKFISSTCFFYRTDIAC